MFLVPQTVSFVILLQLVVNALLDFISTIIHNVSLARQLVENVQILLAALLAIQDTAFFREFAFYAQTNSHNVYPASKKQINWYVINVWLVSSFLMRQHVWSVSITAKNAIIIPVVLNAMQDTFIPQLLINAWLALNQTALLAVEDQSVLLVQWEHFYQIQLTIILVKLVLLVAKFVQD